MDTTRFTVTLPAARYTALKETAARQGKTMAEIVNESLELYGVKSKADAQALLARARRQAAMTADEAMQLAVRETRAHRGK
ncbi:MAG: hypothetical protein JOY51_01910 [Nevskia sp.]|nr:hypothetical protein [Nevskia sp.]